MSARGGDEAAAKAEAAALFAAVEEHVLGGPGELPASERVRAAAGLGAPGAVAEFVTLVRERAYRVEDRHVAALRAAGLSEDQVFELAVATAVGAAGLRLRAGLAAIAGAEAEAKAAAAAPAAGREP